MRKIIPLLVVLTFSGCASTVEVSGKIERDPPDYVSIDPRRTDWVQMDTPNGIKKVYWSTLSNEQINVGLPLERSFVSIIKKDTEGSVGFATAKFSGSAGSYDVVLDYAKYRDETIETVGDTPCRVGVGVRVLAHVTTTKSNVDLGNIFAIAVAAKAGYLSGRIEVMKIGIDSPQLNFVLPPPTDINDASLQSALQAVSAVRARLYDTNTKLTPHVLAVQFSPINESVPAKKR